MTTYIIISISALIIVSYIFQIIQNKTSIPSVLLLMLLGYLIKYICSNYFDINDVIPKRILMTLGSVGLVLIVLEGLLEIKLIKSNARILKKALLMSFVITISSSVLIAFLFMRYLEISFIKSLLYGIPLSIVGSALVIPSVHRIIGGSKDFMTYESIFSDIIGIMFFNFLLFHHRINFYSIGSLGISLISIIIISLISSIIIIYMFGWVKSNTKIIMIIAVLLLLYNLCDLMKLSSLMLVLIFGLMINNLKVFFLYFRLPQRIMKLFNRNGLELAVYELKKVNCELSFFIKTIFFLVFGYSIDLMSMFTPMVLLIGIEVSLIIYFTRYLSLRYMHNSLFPEMFTAPKGLITILLCYSIPRSSDLNISVADGVLSFVIISSILIMAIGLIPYRVRELISSNHVS